MCLKSDLKRIKHVCMNRHNRAKKPDWVSRRYFKLLDHMRERVRYLHYSPQTEKACVYLAKAFVLCVVLA